MSIISTSKAGMYVYPTLRPRSVLVAGGVCVSILEVYLWRDGGGGGMCIHPRSVLVAGGGGGYVYPS